MTDCSHATANLPGNFKLQVFQRYAGRAPASPTLYVGEELGCQVGHCASPESESVRPQSIRWVDWWGCGGGPNTRLPQRPAIGWPLELGPRRPSTLPLRRPSVFFCAALQRGPTFSVPSRVDAAGLYDARRDRPAAASPLCFPTAVRERLPVPGFHRHHESKPSAFYFARIAPTHPGM